MADDGARSAHSKQIRHRAERSNLENAFSGSGYGLSFRARTRDPTERETEDDVEKSRECIPRHCRYEVFSPNSACSACLASDSLHCRNCGSGESPMVELPESVSSD